MSAEVEREVRADEQGAGRQQDVANPKRPTMSGIGWGEGDQAKTHEGSIVVAHDGLPCAARRSSAAPIGAACAASRREGESSQYEHAPMHGFHPLLSSGPARSRHQPSKHVILSVTILPSSSVGSADVIRWRRTRRPAARVPLVEQRS